MCYISKSQEHHSLLGVQSPLEGSTILSTPPQWGFHRGRFDQPFRRPMPRGSLQRYNALVKVRAIAGATWGLAQELRALPIFFFQPVCFGIVLPCRFKILEG